MIIISEKASIQASEGKMLKIKLTLRVKAIRAGPSYNSGGTIYNNKRVLAKSGGPLDSSTPIHRKPKSAQRNSGLPHSNPSYRKHQMYTVDVRNNIDHNQSNLDS